MFLFSPSHCNDEVVIRPYKIHAHYDEVHKNPSQQGVSPSSPFHVSFMSFLARSLVARALTK